ncbi:MAG: AI-2E family transporter [Thermoleophilia bacterium]|nr:AI-2E family transporter [Thermoleophilia bacterium]
MNSIREKILVPKYVQYILLPIALLLGLWFVSIIRTIIIMFLLATILAFVLDQPVSLLHDKVRIPRILAVLIVWVILLAILAGAIALIVPNVISELNYLIDQIPEYTTRTESIVRDLQRWFGELDLPYKPDITPGDIAGKLASGGEEVAMRALGFAQLLFNMGLNAFLIVVISIYMLIDASRLKKTAREAFPPQFQADAVRLFERVQTALGSYLRGQLLVSTIMGILGGMIAFYGGAGTYVFIIAVWVALTEVIPLIGPFLGAAPAVILAYFTVSPTRAMWVALLFLIVQQLEGHILVPRIMGKSVGVHPLWVMFAVLSGASIAGLPGGLLAVPMVAIIKVTIDFCREEMVLEKWDRPLLEKKPVEDGESA